MKIFIFCPLLIILPWFTGCSSDFKTYISKKADSAVVSCYTNKSPNNNSEIKITSKENILTLANYISNDSSPFFKCGYNGTINFLRNNKSIVPAKIEFNTHPGCAHFFYIHDEKAYAKKITPDGIAFLTKFCPNDN